MTPNRPAHRPSKGDRVKHTLRLPVGLDAPLRQRAEAHGRSLNDELVALVAAAVNGTPEQVADRYTERASPTGRLSKPSPELQNIRPRIHPEN